MRISVALCTYNGEKFLEKQLDSILSQTICVNEIIVCDDKSVDQTKTILEKYSKDNPGIFKIYYNEKNLRSNKNFEKAIKLTTGDYIFLSDQDDLWINTKVEKTLNIFKENPTAEGVFSDATLIDKNDVVLSKDSGLWDSVCFFEKSIPKPIDLHLLLIFTQNFLTGATLCINKTVKEFCFPFRTIEDSLLHDEWFALILSERNTLFYSPEKLISYRIHSGQQIGVGSIKSHRPNLSKELGIALRIYSPQTYKDFKTITRTLFNKYEKYKALNLKNNNSNKKTENRLLNLYQKADANMKKSHPILYYIILENVRIEKKERDSFNYYFYFLNRYHTFVLDLQQVILKN